MNEVFPRGPSLLSRLIIALTLSVLAMLIDTKINSFEKARTFLNSLVAPLQYIADMPSTAMDWTAESVSSRQDLMADNQRLTYDIMLMTEKLQRFEIIMQENADLRKLLDAPLRVDTRKKIAELLAVDTNPYSHQIVVNKGAIDDVFVGQPVLDDRGIVGQVIEVSTTNSRVLLISDVTHGIPTRIKRNNVRFVVNGNGDLSKLNVQHVPHSADIRVGDILVSSGLGKVFPEGYPVGSITQINRDESRPFADVEVKPIAQLDRLKYLLLLWPQKDVIGDSDETQ